MRDSNSQAFRRWCLKPVRLPISPIPVVYQSFQEFNKGTQAHDFPFLSSLLKLTLSMATIAFFYVKRHAVPINVFDAFTPYPLRFKASAPNAIQPPLRPLYFGLLFAFTTAALWQADFSAYVALTAFYEVLYC